MSDAFFRQIIKDVCADSLMLIPNSFESTNVTSKNYQRSPLIGLMSMDSLITIDSTKSFVSRWAKIMYKDKRRQKEFSDYSIRIWSFKTEQESKQLFSIIKTNLYDKGYFTLPAAVYLRKGNNIVIISCSYEKDWLKIRRIRAYISKRYMCLGRVEFCD